MRSKALLVGARASFLGPRVRLEEGRWLVDPPPSVAPHISVYVKGRTDSLSLWPLTIDGPCIVRAATKSTYEGSGVHLDARLVSDV